jgi:hypothetical protein
VVSAIGIQSDVDCVSECVKSAECDEAVPAPVLSHRPACTLPRGPKQSEALAGHAARGAVKSAPK